MKRISCTILPKSKHGWSIKDYLVCDWYNYHIGRTKDGEWVDMDNKPVKDALFYIEIEEVSKDEYNKFISLQQK